MAASPSAPAGAAGRGAPAKSPAGAATAKPAPSTTAAKAATKPETKKPDAARTETKKPDAAAKTAAGPAPTAAGAAEAAGGQAEPEAKADGAGAGEAGEAKTAGAGEAGEAKAAETKKTRQQMAHVLGISISQARCAAHLKKAVVDEKTADELQRLREAHKKALAAQDAGAGELKAQISRLSNQVVRLSSDTSIAVAVLWDTAVKELLRFGLARANSGGRRLMGVAHLHEKGVEELPCFPLYGPLAAFRDFKPEAEDAQRKDRAAAAKAARETKQARPKPAAAAPGDESDESSKTSFNTYIEAALKEVKRAEGLTALRSAASLRGHVAQLVADGIHRLAGLAQILVVHATGARTMTAENVKAVVRLLLTDAHRAPEAIDRVLAAVDEKLELHRRHLAAEKAKKEELLSPEARALAAQKASAAARERTTRQIASAKRRAEEATKKAAELAGRLDEPAAGGAEAAEAAA